MAARVLFDLSIAGLGYSGIPQDTRCNFHALATETDLDVSGLVYTNLSDRTTFAAIPSRQTTPWLKTWLQARYLEQLVNNSDPRTLSEYVARRINFLERLKLHATAKVRLSEIDNDLFFDVLWRNLLGKSLPAAERTAGAAEVLHFQPIDRGHRPESLPMVAAIPASRRAGGCDRHT